MGMKKHFSSAKRQQLELFPAVIMMMPELNALVCIYITALYLYTVNVNDTEGRRQLLRSGGA